ncbi:DUF2087 domain-containing protein [Kitasatospora sp. McL0602]|uniref:DUF2087 domain-containing protein n=1 Tax=Kitasatospora sp. McL0602 TaxID=3439530 RepID=UPI003F8C7882
MSNLPQPTDAPRATGLPQVADLFRDGRIVAVPRKAARREQLLDHLADTLFEPGLAYRESEVNDALRTVHDDFPALRRYLIEGGWLSRTKDGSSYRRGSRGADLQAG